MHEWELRKELCEFGARAYERGFLGASEGNLSVRLGEDCLLCTPSGVSKGHMAPEDLVRIDLAGQPVEEHPKGLVPSSEIRMHVALYAQRPDCMAVVHAHPLIATGFAYAGQTVATANSPEGAAVLGPVALVPFGMPGTDELPDALRPFATDHKTFLLANHGAVTIGSSVQDAYFRMETLERLARVTLVAQMLGGIQEIPASELKRLHAALVSGQL